MAQQRSDVIGIRYCSPMEKSTQSSWEQWGRLDPLWAIITIDGKEFGRWDLDEFFNTGHETIHSLWSTASELGLPHATRRALDFGCGVGRLTRALGEHVDQVIGLDVAPSMIRLAHEYNAEQGNLTFLIHDDTDLHRFEDGRFDVVCCLLVLQHLASDRDILTYIEEFVRVLAQGGLLLLQLPVEMPPAHPRVGFRSALRPRTRLAQGLLRLGVPPEVLYRHLKFWRPEMTMRAVSRDSVLEAVEAKGGRLVLSSDPAIDPSGVHNLFCFITRD